MDYRKKILAEYHEIKKRSPLCLHDPARIDLVVTAYRIVSDVCPDTVDSAISVVCKALLPDKRRKEVITALQSHDFCEAIAAMQKHPLVAKALKQLEGDFCGKG